MTPTRRTRSLFSMLRTSKQTPSPEITLRNPFQGFELFLKDRLVTPARDHLAQIREKMKNLPQTNYDLGCVFANRQKWADALFRFRVAIYLQPDFAQAYYQASTCYLQLGKRAQAKQFLSKTLALDPTHAEALYVLTAIDARMVSPSQRPTRMPLSMVQGYFETIAEDYNSIERAKHYQAARVLSDIIPPFLGDRTHITVLDLGCGSGIAARPWRTRAKSIIGVDATPAMLEAARLVRVGNDIALFDGLMEADLLALSLPTDALPLATTDLTLLIQVAPFLGDLTPLLIPLSTALPSGSLFALTYEPFTGETPFAIHPDTGRFGHDGAFLETQLTQMGWRILHHAPIDLYPTHTAQLMVLTR